MIIVTGASQGIGFEIATRLHEKGESVLGLSRNSQNQKFRTENVDVSNFKDLKKISDRIRNSNEYISSVINVAGVASMNMALMANPETSEKLVKINFLGTVYSSQIFAPLLIRNGGGVILNFSSIAAAINIEGEAVYAATKSAVETYSKTLAKELSKFRIRVNCIAPGPIKTNLLRGVSDNQVTKIIESQIVQQQYTAADVANIVELLLDDRASSISGQVIHIGGFR
jgi:3-oxoacyl-[acyl-carrier protein] reductase